MSNIPIEVNTGETKTITFHTAGTFNTEDITFSITAAGGDANSTLSGFAYCSTPAATSTKTADMPGFELVTNQRIILQLVTTNSATSNVKLSVNGTDAKPVYIGSNVAGTNFTAGYYVALYNGTNWVLTKVYWSDANSTLSGIAYCSTTNSTKAKSATMPGFALSTYQRVLLYHSVNSTVASATLSINSTTAKTIKIDGANTTATNFTSGWWLCYYDGSYWNLSKLAFTDTDTTVIDSDHHYQPSTNDDYTLTKSASGATAAWETDVVTGVTVNRDPKGHVTDVSVTSGKIPANPNTDTKVTSADNHYTPATVDGQNKSASASGASAAWSIDVVKGVTLNTDGKGHVTGISVTSGKIPANPNTDTKVTQTYYAESDYTYWRPLVVGYSSGSTEGFTPSTATNTTVTFKTITCQPSTGTIRAGAFKKIGGTSSQFLKADGSVDSNSYSTTSHNHSGVYKPVQTAVSDPTASTTTSTTFIDTISQDTNGVITATKKNLPAYLSAVSALSATPAASLSDKTLTFKQFSQATSAQVSAADSSTKLHFNTAPTETNKIATMSDVTSAFQVNDAMIFKGTLGTNGTVTALPAKHYQGWTYKVITAGTWAGVTCEVGDMVICITDGTSANNAHWTVVQSNIDGAVTGPASSASGNVVTFNGTTGKLIQDSGFTIGKSVPSDAKFTDTKVTSSANHYTPETVSGQDKSASASGGSAAWSIDVVKGVTLNTDGKGHVTGISVTSGKLPSNPNTDTKVSQSSTTTANYRKVLLAHNSNASAGADVVTETDVVYGAKLVEVQPSTGTLRANAFVKVDGSALQFLKADGSVDSSKYALESHNHDGDYQPVGNYKTTQTAVSDPSVPTSGITTSTSFIDTISQNTNGVITVTKKNIPTASTTVAGITTVGASGGAAAYSHTHSYASSSHTHGNITNAGALQSTGVDIANNDCLVVTDASNSAKVAKTTTVFDGSTTSQFLTKKGTFESLPTASTTAAGITTVGASGGAASYGHDHNGVYQPVGNYKTTQTAVSSPTAGTTTASAFIDTISQDTNGVITATKSPIPQDMVVIGTGASTKAKTATVPWTYTLKTGNVFMVVLKTSSTVAAATLSINGTAAKPVYIDGAAATASNWTAGTYLCYYNGTNYYMYTDRSPFQDKKVTPVALSSTGTTNYNILLAYSTTPTTNGQPNYATTAKINGKGEITATKFKLSSGTGFLKADGSVDSNTYSTSNHTHSGYKTTQTAVSDPSVPESGTTTSTTFIDTISQNANGVITATKKNLPTASTETAGIIKIGTTETTAAAGNHTHTFESLTSKPTTLAGYGITDATDTKVTQTVTGSSNSSWRPLIIGGSFSDATTFAPSTTTTTTYATHLAKFKPSTGVLGIVGLNKMNTNGKVADGSNNTLWNTNGGTTTIATVATSGSYSDLSNKPPIPTMVSELTNDVGYTDNIGTVTSVKVGTNSYNPSNGVVSLPEYPTNTDTTVTDADHHYSPSTVSGEDKTASASGATAAWSIDVVKGVTLNTDGKGHVTGISVTSGKIPDNPNTDTKVTQTYASASSYTNWRPLVIGYSAGSEGFTPSTKTDNTYTFSTLTCQPSSGTIRAKSFKVINGTSSQFLKADGSIDSTTYSTSDTKASSVVVGPESSTSVNTDSTGSCFINVVNSNGTVAPGVKIIGSGSVSVSSSHDGIITITGTGGSGGADVTIPDSDITIGTTANTYITVNSTSRKIKLPTKPPSGWLGTSSDTASKGTHSHGTITNGGYIKGNDVQSGGVSNDQVQIANGDRIVIGDFSERSSNIYHPLKLTSIAFDGITATQFLSKKGTWETPITPLATPVATDEDDGIGMEGSVLPVDSISGTSGIVGTKYEISQNFNVAILRPDTSRDGIAFLLPICMDESGHLFLPISESFSNILVNNGYVTSYLDNI